MSELSTIHKLNTSALSDYLLDSFHEDTSHLIPREATSVQIQNLSRISGGRHDTYVFSLSFRHKERNSTLKLILKTYTGKKIAKTEYLALRALENADFSVPHAYALETDDRILGAPFIVMEKVEGKSLRDYVKHCSREETLNLFERFAEALVILHELEFQKMELGFLELPMDEYDFAKKQALREEDKLLEYVREQDLVWATKWLENNALKCPCNRYSLLHGDMNPKNFLITETGRIVFLDWTWAEIGDPLKDVGYAYHNIRHMFGIRNVNKKGAEIAAHFLKQYTRRSSRSVEGYSLWFYLFSAGLREAISLGYLSKKLISPSETIRIFGAKFLPALPLIYWHFRSRCKRLRHFLERIAFDYEQRMFRTPGGRILSSMETKEILRLLKPMSSELILDVGTGSGRIARSILSSAKANVIGIDVGRSNLKSARTRTRDKEGYDTIIADGQYLPFREATFDGIICIRALKYFPNYVLGIAEMSRVLRSGKRLVFDLSSTLGYEVVLRHITHSLSARDSHVFNLYRMRNLLKTHKFIVANSVPLQKIPHRIWVQSNSLTFFKFLEISENILRKTTPLLLSRSVLLKCIKESK